MLSLGLLFAGFSVLLPMMLFGLLVVLVVGVATSRTEPDPHNHRLPATYLTAMLFVLVFTVLFAFAGAVGSVASLVEKENDPRGITRLPTTNEYEMRLRPAPIEWTRYDGGEDEAAAAGALVALLVGGIAGGMLWHYRRTLLELVEREGFREGAGARVVHTYLYATQFVAVLLLVGAGAVAAYGLAQVIVPGLLSEADAEAVRLGGVRLLLTAGALAGGAAVVAVVHQREHGRLEPTPPIA
jgi:hypothetical protein